MSGPMSKKVSFGASSEILDNCYSTLLQDLKEPATVALSKRPNLPGIKWKTYFQIAVKDRRSSEDPELVLEELKK
jgi:hypothetical protein